MTQLYRGLEEIPADFGPSIVTIGNFDGVHCGHRWVIEHVIERARARNAKAIAVTLDPHPARVLRPEHAPSLLTPLPRKLELLQATGLDAVLVLPFTAAYAHTSAAEFARTVLHDALHAVEVHEGEDFRFGYQKESGVEGLNTLGNALGFTAHTYTPRELRKAVISSSRIRTLLREGDATRARVLLGRVFDIDSTPASGRGYGTRYAVPTINLAPYPELVPANGVYITRLCVGEEWFQGVTNVGNRPTFGADSFAIESHLLNFHPVDLNESTPLRLEFLKRLRDEKKFSSPEELKAQILRDVARAQRWFQLTLSLTSAQASLRE